MLETELQGELKAVSAAAGAVCRVFGATLLGEGHRSAWADQSILLITSDAPLTIFSRRGSRAAFGGGLALPDTEVTFPISPSVCLLLDRSRNLRRRRVSEKLAREINRRTAFGAERFVIANIRSKAIDRLVQEAARTRSTPKLDPEVIRQRRDQLHTQRGHEARYG